MEESFPKAVKVENIANILKVTFENGEVKYVKSHWTEEITDALQFGKRKRKKKIFSHFLVICGLGLK